MRKEGITNPNCPTCGRFMDKALVRVLKQYGMGTVKVHSRVVGWVCAKCGLIKETHAACGED